MSDMVFDMPDMVDNAASLTRKEQEREGDRSFNFDLPHSPILAQCTLVMAVVILPIVLTGGLFFIDGPNHLFRLTEMQALLQTGNPSEFFEFGGQIYPNLALDGFAWLLGRFMSPQTTLTLFICLAVTSFIAAALYWRAARGEYTDLPLLLIIALIAYSEPLYWGGFNYLLGLGLAFVCLHRALHQNTVYSLSFAIGQALLVGAMLLISLFPVMVYMSFSLGVLLVVAYEAWRGSRYTQLIDLIKNHWLSAAVVLALVITMDPGQTGENIWDLDTKLTGFLSAGKTTNVPLEYLTSAIILGSIAMLAWARGMNINRYEIAGLLGCIALYLIVPKYLSGVGAADRRLLPAAVMIAVVFVRGPSGAASRSGAVVTTLLLGVMAAKALLFLYLLPPLKQMDAIYETVSKAIPEGATILFVPPVEEKRVNSIHRTQRFMTHVLHLSPLAAGDVYLFHQHPHLLLRSLAGRDVLPTQAFTNFWMKRRPEFRDLPDPAVAETVGDVVTALSELPPGSVSYVVSHLDLPPLLPPGASAQQELQVGPVALYLVTRAYYPAGGSCWLTSSAAPHLNAKQLCVAELHKSACAASVS